MAFWDIFLGDNTMTTIVNMMMLMMMILMMMMVIALFYRAPPGAHWGDQQPLVGLRIVSLKHFVKNCISGNCEKSHFVKNDHHCTIVKNHIFDKKIPQWNFIHLKYCESYEKWKCGLLDCASYIKNILWKIKLCNCNSVTLCLSTSTEFKLEDPSLPPIA